MNRIWIPVLAILMTGCVEKNSFRAAESVVAVRCPRTCEEGTNWFVAAAADLTNILSRVTGRPVALYAEADLPAGATHVIYLGDTAAAKAAGLDAGALKRMEFRIKADGRNAFILANSGSAASYGVSEFLERFADFYFVSLNGDDDRDLRILIRSKAHEETVVFLFLNRIKYIFFNGRVNNRIYLFQKRRILKNRFSHF